MTATETVHDNFNSTVYIDNLRDFMVLSTHLPVYGEHYRMTKHVSRSQNFCRNGRKQYSLYEEASAESGSQSH